MTEPFAVALLLGVAYAASIGGLGTLIGTPPHALLAAFVLENYGYTIGFAQWLLVGLPLVVVLLLTRLLFPRAPFRRQSRRARREYRPTNAWASMRLPPVG